MIILKLLLQVDWNQADKRRIAETVFSDACEYWKRVVDHIY